MLEGGCLGEPLSLCPGHNLAGAPRPSPLPQEDPQNSSLMSPLKIALRQVLRKRGTEPRNREAKFKVRKGEASSMED